MTTPSYHPKTDRVIVIGILLLFWGVVVWQLEGRSLWVDEFLTLQMIRGTLSDVVAASLADIHPPLYFIALHGWVALVGSSDFALRLFSVAGGVIGLALMSVVARQLIGPRAVVPATLLLGVAPAFVEFSRMARYYSWLLALGLLSTKLLLNALERNDWWHWTAYVLTGLALLYTFYLSGVLLVAHVLIVLSHTDRRVLIARWLTAALLVGLGALPWLFVVAGRQVTLAAASGGADLSRSILGFVLGVAASFYTFSVGETLFPWRPEAWVGLVVVFVLLGVGLLKQSGRTRWQSVGVFVVSIILLSAMITFVAAGTPFLNVPVRALFALPYYLLAVTLGLVCVASRKQRVVLGGTLLVVWGVSVFNNFTERQFLNPIYITPAKEAAAFVRENAAITDLVISDYDSVFGHYFLSDEILSEHRYTHQEDEIQIALQELMPTRVWLITIGRDQTRRNSSAEVVRQWLGANYCLERVERYLPIDPVYLKIKNFLLRRSSYEHRLTIEMYTSNCE